MKTTNLLSGLALVFAAAFSAAAQTVSTTPSNSPTFKGRVLDDATGRPVAGVPIRYMFVFERVGDHSVPGSRINNTRTDAEGRYEGVYERPGGVGTGHYAIETLATNYVCQVFYVDEADIGKMATIPDTRLRRGGWISGRLERPAEAKAGDSAYVKLESQGPLPDYSLLPLALPDHSLLPIAEADRDGKFRTPLLPAGSYTLHGNWLIHSTDRITGTEVFGWKTWQYNSVSNVNVTVGQETTNVFIPTNNMIIRKDSTGRR